MWVQLLTYQRLHDKRGRYILHYAGETVHIKNKEVCAKLIKEKKAVDLRKVAAELPEETGILLLGGGRIPKWATALELETAAGGPALPFEYTILWDPKVKPQGTLITVALKTVAGTGWEIAVPIYSYHKLAKACGTKEERALTKAVIHDLRVPVYNPGLMFVQRTERTEALMSQWITEMSHPGFDNRLAFMRALYKVKPIILPLPTIWVKKTQ